MELQEKIVVITGGSAGFGKSLAAAFKKEGCQVIISSHEKELLQITADILFVDSFIADVTLQEEIKKLSEYVVQKYGKIDIWINNAGVQILPNMAEEISIEKLYHVFQVNFFGYFYGCQMALAQMKKQSYGIIMNINSTAGIEGKPKIAVYSASKFAVRGLTESIRKETQNLDIQIYGIFPGGMQTDIYKEKYPDDIQEYMDTDSVAQKVIANLNLTTPELDLIIKRPIK